MRYKYQVRSELRPTGITGISDAAIAEHWGLYEGYVANVNLLNERLAALSDRSDFSLEFSELKRRSGFEYDGMILHELYFGGLKAGVKPLGDSAELSKLLKKSFGGFRKWLEEFVAMGRMRGVGWVLMYLDPRSQTLSNHWVGLHESGHPSGFIPVLALDVWEHAYLPGKRAAYIDAFVDNIDWLRLEEILKEARPPAKGPRDADSPCLTRRLK